MKKFLAVIIAAVVVTGTSVGAQESPPAGASLFEASRWISDKQPIDHATWPGFSSFYDYRKEGTLGFMSASSFAGSHPLYSCGRTYRWRGLNAIDRFTSLSANCEGVGSTGALIGYVSSTQIPGTIPLYRCLAGQNHFDSILGCEGYFAEAVLGFVFA